MSVQEHTLGNGLTVLLKESRAAPVTTFWVWYRVGSRHEVPGITIPDPIMARIEAAVRGMDPARSLAERRRLLVETIMEIATR